MTTDAGNFGSFVHRYIGFRQSAGVSVLGGRRDGLGHADGGRGGVAPAGHAGRGFVGDGGALMTGNEIATAIQYGANPIMIISDNAMYGTIGMHSYVRYPERPFMEGTRLTNPDFAAWGRSFGAEGITIRNEAEIADGIARAFAVKTKPGRRALPDLGDADERLAPLHPLGDIALNRRGNCIWRSRRGRVSGRRSGDQQ